jgi:hypothetical protein
MKKFKKQSVEVLSAYTCDKCGREADFDSDGFEAQEFISIEQKAGYASVFGDGDIVCLELCQHCFKELLGSWIKVKKSQSREYW